MALFSRNRNIDRLVADLPIKDKKEVLRLVKGLTFTKFYTNPKISNDVKSKEFGKHRTYILDITQKVNGIMKANGKEPLFSNAHDWNILGRDFVRLMEKSGESW